MPLFLVGGVGVLAALYSWLAADGPGGAVMLYIGSTGLSLGTFGTHNDTALAYMVRSERQALSAAQAAELSAELARDRQEVLDLAPTPKIAWGITAVALALHTWAATLLLA